MKATVLTVSMCDKISKLEPRLYCSYFTDMPVEDNMKREYYDTRMLLSTDSEY